LNILYYKSEKVIINKFICQT